MRTEDQIVKVERSANEQGKIGWILAWAIGIPLPVLVVLYLLFGR